MSTIKTKVTITSIKSLKQGEIIWDTEVGGFGVRMQKRDKVYFLKTRINNKQRQFTIGQHGSPWNPTTARNEAIRLLGEKAAGTNLHTIREGKKQQTTVKELSERYIEEYAISNKKARSVHTDKSNLRNHIVPFFGDMLAKDVGIEDINRFMNNLATGKVQKTPSTAHKGGAVIKGGRGAANRCRALLSKMFNLAEQWRIVPLNSNPVRHSTRYKEEGLENYLNATEMKRLWDILDEKEIENNYSIYLINAIRLLMLTGARVNEIRTLKWEHIDIMRKMAFLPDTKSGKKPMYLSEAALRIINSTQKIKDNPYVFPGKKDQSPIVNFNKPWGIFRVEANLERFRLHDLRHTFASEAINAGTPLALVGGLLGHRSMKTTERYAHLADTGLHRAGNATAQAIADMATNRQEADVN